MAYLFRQVNNLCATRLMEATMTLTILPALPLIDWSLFPRPAAIDVLPFLDLYSTGPPHPFRSLNGSEVMTINQGYGERVISTAQVSASPPTRISLSIPRQDWFLIRTRDLFTIGRPRALTPMTKNLALKMNWRTGQSPVKLMNLIGKRWDMNFNPAQLSISPSTKLPWGRPFPLGPHFISTVKELPRRLSLEFPRRYPLHCKTVFDME